MIHHYSVEETDDGYRVSEESPEAEGLAIEIDISVPDEFDVTDVQKDVVTTYAGNILTFIRKNNDYGSSFTNASKVESILKHGEVVDEEIPRMMARQIFVRGFLDKISRFYTLYIEDGEAQVDESTVDTLLDLGNYAIMLASQIRRYGGDEE